MTLDEFFEKIEASEDTQGVSVDRHTMTLAVLHTPTKLCTEFDLEGIERNDWDTIREIIIGEREHNVLSHMSRVIGYYSRIENWNKSKIGELKDRHKGNYEIV